MASRGWRVAAGMLVVPAVVGGLAGCSSGGQPASTSATAKAASVEGITVAMLKSALLTHVNGVGSASSVSSGTYAAVSQASTGKQSAGGVTVTPKACTGSATEGFDPTALAGSPAAAVTFRVGTNAVSEVLVASTDQAASAALAGHIPAGCARYQEKAGGKTFSYGITEQAITGVGAQAKVLNVQEAGVAADDQWSLIYRGTHFVGTVTVIGANASEKAVQELGQQAYAYAAKTLS